MGFFKKSAHSDKQAATAEAPKPVAAEPVHVLGAEFEHQVLRSEQPVVVDFWAEWCGPCHAIAPSVAKLADEYAGRALVAKVDADEAPDILSRYGIMGIPTLIYFKGGEEMDRIVGVTQYGTLKNKMERLLA
jgi:thioredoxin 1